MTANDSDHGIDIDKTTEHENANGDDDAVDESPEEIDAITENDHLPENPETDYYRLTEEDKTCFKTLLMNSNRKKKRFTPDALASVHSFRAQRL